MIRVFRAGYYTSLHLKFLIIKIYFQFSIAFFHSLMRMMSIVVFNSSLTDFPLIKLPPETDFVLKTAQNILNVVLMGDPRGSLWAEIYEILARSKWS